MSCFTSSKISLFSFFHTVFEFQVFGLGCVAQVVTGNGFFGEYLSINVGFGLSVAMGVHIGGKVSGESFLTPNTKSEFS